jgi:hypothetical protein
VVRSVIASALSHPKGAAVIICHCEKRSDEAI